jgi:hypothetical protein
LSRDRHRDEFPWGRGWDVHRVWDRYLNATRTPPSGGWPSSSLLSKIITKVDQTIFDSSEVLRKIVVVAGSHLINIVQVIQQKINVMRNNRLRRDDSRSLSRSD